MPATVGPDKLLKDHWYTFDTCGYDGKMPWAYNRAQSIAVQVRSYRDGKYTVVCRNGYRFRVYASDLTV